MSISGISGPSNGEGLPSSSQVEQIQTAAKSLAEDLRDIAGEHPGYPIFDKHASSAIDNLRHIATLLAPYEKEGAIPTDSDLSLIMGMISHLTDVAGDSSNALLQLASTSASTQKRVESSLMKVFDDMHSNYYSSLVVFNELLNNLATTPESSIDTTPITSNCASKQLYNLLTCAQFKHLIHEVGANNAMMDPILINMVSKNVEGAYGSTAADQKLLGQLNLACKNYQSDPSNQNMEGVGTALKDLIESGEIDNLTHS